MEFDIVWSGVQQFAIFDKSGTLSTIDIQIEKLNVVERDGEGEITDEYSSFKLYIPAQTKDYVLLYGVGNILMSDGKYYDQWEAGYTSLLGVALNGIEAYLSSNSATLNICNIDERYWRKEGQDFVYYLFDYQFYTPI